MGKSPFSEKCRRLKTNYEVKIKHLTNYANIAQLTNKDKLKAPVWSQREKHKKSLLTLPLTKRKPERHCCYSFSVSIVTIEQISQIVAFVVLVSLLLTLKNSLSEMIFLF